MKHLREFVTSVPEYRRTGKGNFKHKLEDILMLVILGRLSKCITKTEILEFGKRYPIWIINRQDEMANQFNQTPQTGSSGS